MSSVISNLLEQPYRYGLFQAISLLERYAATQTGSSEPEVRSLVKLKSSVSMAFPSADIQAIRSSDTALVQFEVHTAVMGLAGLKGPLPQVFTEMLLASRRNKDKAPLDFLDVFNHRLLYLLYQVKQKYHLSLANEALKQHPALRLVDALASLGEASSPRAKSHAVWLRHASLQGAAPRSIEGLIAVLRDRLGITFNAQQFVGVWLDLSLHDHAALGCHPVTGGRSQLGENATLGRRFWDQGGAFLLKSSSVAADVFYALLPGQALHRELKWLVDRYQSSSRKVGVELAMDPKKFKAKAIGTPGGPQLGLTSWLSVARASTSGATESHPAPKFDPCRFWLTDTHASLPAFEAGATLG